MNKLKFLSGNALKLFALVFMTIDHVGYLLLDNYIPFRIIGRLAFPIFAYMIAEGCKHTKNRARYLLTVFLTGAAFQIFYSIAERSLYMNIFITFSFSIALIYLFDWAKSMNVAAAFGAPVLALCAVFLIAFSLPAVTNNFFRLDYDFVGILIPVAVYFAKKPLLKLVLLAVLLAILSATLAKIQFFSLLSIPLLSLYNGKRGKLKLKYLFYTYYPLHNIALYFILFLKERI